MSKVENTISQLVNKHIIPSKELFVITEELIQAYIEHYGNHNSLKYGNLIYARKLAGLALMKLNFTRGGNSKTCKEGLVYLIENPAFPDHLKIGMTVDLTKRLASYQMYDPHKQFRVKQYEFVLDRRRVEQNMLNSFNIHLTSGEWIKFSDSNKIMKSVRSNNWIVE